MFPYPAAAIRERLVPGRPRQGSFVLRPVRTRPAVYTKKAGGKPAYNYSGVIASNRSTASRRASENAERNFSLIGIRAPSGPQIAASMSTSAAGGCCVAIRMMRSPARTITKPSPTEQTRAWPVKSSVEALTESPTCGFACGRSHDSARRIPLPY